MNMPTPEKIREALGPIVPTGSDQSIVALGWVSTPAIQDGKVSLALEVPDDQAPHLEPVRAAAEQALAALDGVDKASVVLTAAAAPAQKAEPPQMKIGRHGDPSAKKIDMKGVKKVIAVASGKGGVGKSTVSANLACGLARLGLKVALLDADIYGPSQPRLFGVDGQKPESDGKVVTPVKAYDVSLMSMGFMLDEDQPVVWRGPMVMGALQQMLGDVNWGETDVLLLDMPPGTGDAQLTVAQKLNLDGAVIVSTPQDIALLDARKGISMFRKVDVPILGLLENMSYHVCSMCGAREETFSHGGAKKAAESFKVPFLGELPLDIKIRETSDAGGPVTATEPESYQAGVFMEIAETVKKALFDDIPAAPPKAPTGRKGLISRLLKRT